MHRNKFAAVNAKFAKIWTEKLYKYKLKNNTNAKKLRMQKITSMRIHNFISNFKVFLQLLDDKYESDQNISLSSTSSSGSNDDDLSFNED